MHVSNSSNSILLQTTVDSLVPTEEKIAIVDRLSAVGVDEIEVTSFTHPDAVPNLRDAEAVAEAIDRHESVCYRALVPNAVGMERALDAGVDKVNALLSVSETYGANNQNMGREESIDELRRIVDLAAGTDVAVEAGISTSFYCPYEGRVPLAETLEIVGAAVDAGVDEVTLAVTMGLADPAQVSEAVTAVQERWPDLDLGLYLHDTNGMALANTLVALQQGIDRFDASVCGVGGGVVLPEGLDGVGNVPTEDLLHLLSRTCVCSTERFDSVASVAKEIAGELDAGTNSHVVRGGTVENVLDEMNRDR